MSSRVIRIKIGTEEHELVKREGGCSGCSLELLCLKIGVSDMPMCRGLMYWHGDMIFDYGKFKKIKG